MGKFITSTPVETTGKVKIIEPHPDDRRRPHIDYHGDLARAEAGYRSRDIVDRLQGHLDRKRGLSMSAIPDQRDADVRDAIAEIEWLRAARPDAVTRGELSEMARKLREASAVVGGLLARIEGALGDDRK